MMHVVVTIALLGVCASTVDAATDLAVTPKKLVVIDKTATSGTAAIKLAIADKSAGITNGPDESQEISGRFSLEYAGGSPAGAFSLNGWAVNKATVSKFVNKSAPLGGSAVKIAKVVPGKLIKVAAKGIGTFDVLAAGPPAGSIFTSFCVANAGTDTCHCAEFTECLYKPIAGGTGAKLVCSAGVGDPACTAAIPLGTTCCQLAPGFCGAGLEEHYGDVEKSCLSVGGAPGPRGSVCDATGSCVPGPGVPGSCCETTPTECIAADEPSCDSVSGTYFPSAVCGAGGRCL